MIFQQPARKASGSRHFSQREAYARNVKEAACDSGKPFSAKPLIWTKLEGGKSVVYGPSNCPYTLPTNNFALATEMVKEKSESLNVVTAIQSGRWKRATFTTFTLSLTFFESYIWPRLRRQGCEVCDIIVDNLGYVDSLSERQSRSVGRDYRLVVARPKKGIFHAKIVHLWAEEGDGDLLLVGSGNLTYSGHGGNLEVLEGLSANKHSTAFGEAANFFAELPEHVETVTHGPFAAVSQRLLQLSHAYPNKEDVHFVHSLERAGGEQFVDALRGRDIKKLVVLSPYHNPMGEPVRKLIRELGPVDLRIAVPGGEMPSSFNFAQFMPLVADKELHRLSAVCPRDDERALHAKWFEASGTGFSVAFTGSFNATTTSLDTTNNVEAGVIRVMGKSRDVWENTSIPEFVASEFPRSDISNAMYLQGALRDNLLKGTIFGSPLSGPWSAYLLVSDLVAESGTVEVKSDGSFGWVLESPPLGHEGVGLQLRLSRGNTTVRGWVDMPSVLALSSQKKRLLEIVESFKLGLEDEDDVEAVINFTMSQIAVLINATAPTNNSTKTPPSGTDSTTTKNEEYLSHKAFDAATDPSDDDVENNHGMPVSTAASSALTLKKLAAILLGLREERRGTKLPKNVFDTELTKDDAEKDKKKDDKMRASFDRLWQSLREVVGPARVLAKTDATGNTEGLISAIFEIALTSLIRAYRGRILDDSVGALRQIGNWLLFVTKFDHPPTTRRALLPHVAGVSAVLARQHVLEQTNPLQIGQGRTREDANWQQPHKRVPYLLEYFYQGTANRDEVLAGARRWLCSDLGMALIDDEFDEAIAALELSLEDKTTFQRIHQHLGKKRVPTRDEFPEFSDTLLRWLSEACNQNGPVNRNNVFEVSIFDTSNCPGYHELKGGPENLKRFGIHECPDCGKKLVTRYDPTARPIGSMP